MSAHAGQRRPGRQGHGRSAGSLCRRSSAIYGLGGGRCTISCAVVPFVHPELIEHRACHVHMELASPEVRGTTICDLRTFLSEPSGVTRRQQPANALVALKIDGAAVVDKVVDAVTSYGK